MLKLYHAPMACSLASRFALLEAGLEHEIRIVHTTKGENRTAEYLALNPFGKVPLLQTPDGELTESSAILPYIADLAPEKRLYPEAGTFARAEARSLMGFLTSGLHCAYTPAFHTDEQADRAHALDAAVRKIDTALRIVEQRLEGREYLLGTTSVADLFMMPFSLWRMAPQFAGRFGTYPNIDALQARVLSRPALDGIVAEEMALRAQNMPG